MYSSVDKITSKAAYVVVYRARPNDRHSKRKPLVIKGSGHCWILGRKRVWARKYTAGMRRIAFRAGGR